MKESVKGARHDGGREGQSGQSKEENERRREKNKLIKEYEEDMEDTQSVSWSLVDWHDVRSILAVCST